jgi:radical SAM superfamily enzyme YgiQ (UPF0313 family)
MIAPRFGGWSFWDYRATCELAGAKYPQPPLGLITVAGMLPKNWSVRLVDRNIEEVTPDDFAWADLIMTGGMLPQQRDMLVIIDQAHRSHKPCAVGGADPTSSPHIYASADFRVLGEAEGVIDDFVAAWRDGRRSGVFESVKYQVDVTRTPPPRYDLLKHWHYADMGMQFSRGCPFICEFCDIIELYGRRPRTKTVEQMRVELETLYDTGYRGFVELVDDNLIGNKKAVKVFLAALVEWQRTHNYPFEFSTQASVNLADDAAMLDLMMQAGFVGVFLGIESPEEEVLVGMQKKQNTHRNIADNIRRIYDAGMFVSAGFIVGFDHESRSVVTPITNLIEDAAIPFPTIGLLFALPNTQLMRRLKAEGRLHANHDIDPHKGNPGLNFETKRNRVDILMDQREIVRRIYDVDAYCDRVMRAATQLNLAGPSGRISSARLLPDLRKFVRMMWNIHRRCRGFRGRFWRTLLAVVRKNPRGIKPAMVMLAFYAHLNIFSRSLIKQTDDQIEALRSSPSSPRRDIVDVPLACLSESATAAPSNELFGVDLR